MATALNPLEGIKQDKDGNFIDVVDLGDGSGPQVFKGKTIADLVASYRKAQLNATKKIREQATALRLQATPDRAVPEPTYRPHIATADELWQLSEDLKDPAKAAAALVRATEWQLGASLAEVRETIVSIRTERDKRAVFAAGEAFMNAHPEYKRCKENEDAIFAYLEQNQLAYTRKNFEIAFEYLKPGLELQSPRQSNPQGNEPDARIETPVVTRPRIASTGLSPRTSSAVPPTGNPTAQRTGKLTEADIDAMDTNEYLRRISSDSTFAAEAERVLSANRRR